MIFQYNRKCMDIILECLLDSICHLNDENKISEINKKAEKDLDKLYEEYFGDLYE